MVGNMAVLSSAVLLCIVWPALATEIVHPNSFALIGPGSCLTIGAVDVWGRSRRDVSHSLCRELCAGPCIGYSYAPCERVCTLHGDPSTLVDIAEEASWNVINGGGRIAISSQECGYSCYIRMLDCPSGFVTQNGLQLPHGPVGFRMQTSLPCPEPFVGTLSLTCTATGVAQTGGRCRSQCLPSNYSYLSWEIEHGAIRHGEIRTASCPSGAIGEVNLTCIDGEVSMIGGGCGNSCAAGSLHVSSAELFHDPLDYGSAVRISCPRETHTGSVRIRCADEGIVPIAGTCRERCVAGAANVTLFDGDNATLAIPALRHEERVVAACIPLESFVGAVEVVCIDGDPVAIPNSTEPGVSNVCRQHCAAGIVGEGVKSSHYPFIRHGEQVYVPCAPGFSGERHLRCDNGEITVVYGECYMNCVPGTVTSNLVALPHGGMDHNDTVDLVCPENYTGTLEVYCDDGTPVVAGFCGEQCAPGVIVAQDAEVSYASIPHGGTVAAVCPLPYAGNIELRCFDRRITQLGGLCYQQCAAGSLNWNDAVINWADMIHGTVLNITCQAPFAGLTFSGYLTMECVDGVTRRVSGDCAADCSAFEVTSGGIAIPYPDMDAFSELDVDCSADGMYGAVTVYCEGGFAEVVGGSCGNPCEAGQFFADVTRDTEVFVERVGHNKDVWVTCPEPLSGTFHLMCTNARYTLLEGECGERCPVAPVSIPGAIFDTVQTDHRQMANYSCSEGFSGLVITTCTFGVLSFDNRCSEDCVAGIATLNGFNMSHGDIMAWEVRPEVMCPPGFTGSVNLTCLDAVVQVAAGACAANCEAGTYEEDTLEVMHPEIDHGASLEQRCPAPLFGDIMLQCQDGMVSRLDGACFENCPRGNYTLRPGVVQSHGRIQHGENVTGFQCPDGFFGVVTLSCMDGSVSRSEGTCMAACQPADILGASHGLLAHDEVATLPCRASGEMTVRCFDGEVQVLSGYCFRHCAAGSINDANNVVIAHAEIEPNRTIVGQCSALSTGTVTLLCNDGTAEEQPLPGEGCLRGCPPSTATAVDGASVEVPTLEHGAWLLMSCPDDELGVLTISCTDGDLIVDGKCGSDNCAAGTLENFGAELEYPNMNHESEEGPIACAGERYIGEAVIWCELGVSSVSQVTLLASSWPTTGPYVNDTQQTPEEDRFTLCGCCLPLERPPDESATARDDTGILVWVALTVGTVCLGVAFGVGFVVFMQAQQFAATNSVRKVAPVEDVEVAKQTPDADVAKPPKQMLLDAELVGWDAEPGEQVEPEDETLDAVVIEQVNPTSPPQDTELPGTPQDVERPVSAEKASNAEIAEPAEPVAT